MDSSIPTNENKIDTILNELRPLIRNQIKEHPDHGSIQIEIIYREGDIQRLVLRSEKSLLLV
jgi:hypothetical protein